MAAVKDYIPSRDAAFDAWFLFLLNYVIAKTAGENPPWYHIPAASVTGLQSAYNLWHTAYEKTVGAHTPAETLAKKAARKSATDVIRPFVAQYLKFSPVTSEERKEVGVNDRETEHTSVPSPATRAVITDMRAIGGYQVKLWFRDELTPDSHAIPYGFSGCLLNYTWGKERVSDVTEMKETVLMTRSPWTLTLPPAAQASFLSCVTRWINEKGQIGPWGIPSFVVIG
jgi:hypothetical protein